MALVGKHLAIVLAVAATNCGFGAADRRPSSGNAKAMVMSTAEGSDPIPRIQATGSTRESRCCYLAGRIATISFNGPVTALG